MDLDIIAYTELTDNTKAGAREKILTALLKKGIVGIRDVPDFVKKSHDLIQAARGFSLLKESVKQQYAPNRDVGEVEGYELGAERFQDTQGIWQVDNKKASFYASVPNKPSNKWPDEIDLRTSYLALAEIMLSVGKQILEKIGLNQQVGINADDLEGVGRLLHYQKVGIHTSSNPNWCGAHFDHGMFTALMPAYYFRSGELVNEPDEAGLFILPHDGERFEKINASDHSVLLFQAGEFGQLASNDGIKATKHLVKKASGDIERFAFAVFFLPIKEVNIRSHSILTKDARYVDNALSDNSITYNLWANASLERYRAQTESS